jgi:hypothetical protein
MPRYFAVSRWHETFAMDKHYLNPLFNPRSIVVFAGPGPAAAQGDASHGHTDALRQSRKAMPTSAKRPSKTPCACLTCSRDGTKRSHRTASGAGSVIARCIHR